MSGGGGGGDTSTVTEKADPWSGVQPYLKDFYAKAQDFSNTTPADRPWYPNDPVVDYRNPYYNQSINTISDTFGGLNQQQQSFIQPYQWVTDNFASDLTNPSSGWWQVNDRMPNYLTAADYMAQNYNPNIAATDWSSTLNQTPGYQSMMSGQNPYLEQHIQNFRTNAQDQLARQQLANQDMSIATGNLGGSRDVMGEMLLDLEGNRGINDAETAMRLQAYGADEAQRTARNQQYLGYLSNMQGLESAFGTNALNASLGFGGTLGEQQSGFMSDAARTQMGMYGLAPGMYGFNQSNYLAPYQSAMEYGNFLGGLGQDLGSYEQALLNNNIANYEYDRDMSLNNLNAYASWLSGAGSLGGGRTATTTMDGAGGSSLMGALGGGMAGYQLGSMLPSMLSIGTAGGAPIYGSSLAAGAAGMGAWPLAIGGALMGGLLAR